MKIAPKFLWLIILPLSYSLSFAQTLENIIQTAIETNPSIKMSNEMINGTDKGIESAKWGYFPSPSIDIEQGKYRSLTFRIDQPLWTGGKLDATYNLALAKKEESIASYMETSYSLIDNILKSSLMYLQEKGSMQANQEGKIQLEKLSQMLDRRVEAGVSSLSDRELIISRLTLIENEIEQSKLKVNFAKSQIEILSGEKINEDIIINKTNILFDDTFENVMNNVKATHPTLKRMDSNVKMSLAELEKAKSTLWPNISARAEQSKGSIYNESDISNRLVYVNVSISPGAGLSSLSGIEQAQSNYMKTTFERMSKEKDISEQVLKDFIDYKNAKEQLSVLDKTIEASENVFESYKRLFIAGKRQWLDLVNASKELTQYKANKAQLEAMLTVSAYQLQLKQGILFEKNKIKGSL